MAATEMKLKQMSPASKEKREITRKQCRCQKCLAKTPIDEQYTVTNDLKKGKAVKRQDAKDQADKSHYCGDCADKRVKMKEAWLRRRAKAAA